MARRNADPLIGEPLRRGESGVTLGGEGDEPGEATAGIKKTPGIFDGGRKDRAGRVGTDVALLRVNERAFDVETGNDLLHKRILVPKSDQCLKATLHGTKIVRDDGGENGIDAVC